MITVRVVASSSLFKWRAVTSDVPQVLVLRLMLFNIIVSVMDSGINCTLGKFADDAKLCGAVNTLKRRDAIQNDLDRLVWWACEKPREVLHVDQCNLQHKHRLGGERTESSPEGKYLWILES